VIINRYLTKEVYLTATAVTTVLLFIFLSNQFVRYLAKAAAGKFPGAVVLKLMMVAMPQLLALLLPLGMYLGLLLTLGRLHADREMTVLSACGYSQGQLTKLMLGVSSFIVLFVAVLMLWMSPKVLGLKREILKTAEAGSMIETLMPGRFQASSDGKQVYYVESISRDKKRLENVFMAEQSDSPDVKGKKTWDVMSAKGGYQYTDEITHERFVVASNGNRYLGVPGQKEFHMIQFEKYGLRLSAHKTKFTRKHNAMPTKELIKNYGKHPKFAAELQWRLSVPLSVWVLILLAIPLSSVSPRQGKYAKLLPAILIYIFYVNLMIVAQDWVEDGKVPTWIGVWWVHAVFLGLAGGLCRFDFSRTFKLRSPTEVGPT